MNKRRDKKHPVDSVMSNPKHKMDLAYARAVSAYAASAIKETDAVMKVNLKRKGKKSTLKNKYKYLRSELECLWANNTFVIDELVALRAFRAEALELLKDIGQVKWDHKRVALLKKYKEYD